MSTSATSFSVSRSFFKNSRLKTPMGHAHPSRAWRIFPMPTRTRPSFRWLYWGGISSIKIWLSSKMLAWLIFSFRLTLPPTNSIRGTGGFSKSSIRKRPELDSSESTTRTLRFLSSACLASSVTSALLPLPPFPQITTFIAFRPFCCTSFKTISSDGTESTAPDNYSRTIAAPHFGHCTSKQAIPCWWATFSPHFGQIQLPPGPAP